MVKVRGRSEVRAYFAKLPEEIERKLLQGAVRAAVKVIANEARERSISTDVRQAIKTRVTSADGKVIGKIFLKGRWANSLGIWLEYGTEGHFISVDMRFSQGRTAKRVNKLDQDGAKTGEQGPRASLFINGEPVGSTVWHPGARPHPFLRPALDIKGSAAIAAAQGYINARIRRSGITGSAEGDGGGE